MTRTIEPTTTPATWGDLDGMFDPAVLAAPKTSGDPLVGVEYPAVGRRPAGYLRKWVVGSLWADHLALIAAVLTAERCDASTVYNVVTMLHRRLTDLFRALGLTDLTEWEPEDVLRRYLRGELVPGDSPATRLNFMLDYCRAARATRRWLEGLPSAERERYRRFVLPPIDPDTLADVMPSGEVAREQQRNRKDETDAVVPHFVTIRALAHRRFNRLVRLRQQFLEAVRRVEAGAALPLEFAYKEGESDPQGTPPEVLAARERLHFRLWDRVSFTLAHRERYGKNPLLHAKNRTGTCAPGKNSFFLEFVRAERLGDDAPPEELWFLDIVRAGVLNRSADEIYMGSL